MKVEIVSEKENLQEYSSPPVLLRDHLKEAVLEIKDSFVRANNRMASLEEDLLKLRRCVQSLVEARQEKGSQMQESQNQEVVKRNKVQQLMKGETYRFLALQMGMMIQMQQMDMEYETLKAQTEQQFQLSRKMIGGMSTPFSRQGESLDSSLSVWQ